MNKEERKEWMKNYRKTEKGKVANSKACEKWREKNPGGVKTISKNYRENNTEKVRECKKRYRDPEKAKKHSKEYRKSEKGKATNQRRHTNRRAREREIINTLTAQEWLDILEKHNYICAYCGTEFDCENLPTRDHIISISKGGNNTKENIIPACQSCNSRKGVKILTIC